MSEAEDATKAAIQNTAARHDFTSLAADAVATPVWCNRFYVQPWPAGVTIVFGGAYSSAPIPGTDGAQIHGANVAASVWMAKDLGLDLYLYLRLFLNITEEEANERLKQLLAINTAETAKP